VRWKWLAAGILLAIGWIGAASFLLCLGRNHLEWFVFPYDQWLIAALYFKHMLWWPQGMDAWMTHPLPWFVLAGLTPSFVLAVLWFSRFGRRKRPSPYGASEWASSADLRAGRIHAKRL
jgi:hypothetical protein